MVDSESSEEHWMYIDEYEDREAFDRMYKAAEDQPDLLYSDDPGKATQLREEKRSLTVPGSAKKELWTEQPELAVDCNTSAQESLELTEARKTLLEHYTHQLTSHYSHLWTVALGNAALLAIAGIFRPLTWGTTISIRSGRLGIDLGPWVISPVDIYLLALGLGFLSGAAIWIFLKCLFYGACCRSVLSIAPSQQGPTMLKRLDTAVAQQNRFTRFMERPCRVFIPLLVLWFLLTLVWQFLISLGILALG